MASWSFRTEVPTGSETTYDLKVHRPKNYKRVGTTATGGPSTYIVVYKSSPNTDEGDDSWESDAGYDARTDEREIVIRAQFEDGTLITSSTATGDRPKVRNGDPTKIKKPIGPIDPKKPEDLKGKLGLK